MNCKPGDLAIVIGGSGLKRYWGFIVRVTRLFPPPYDVCWDYEGAIDSGRGDGYRLAFIPDCCLRPIPALPIDEETREELTA